MKVLLYLLALLLAALPGAALPQSAPAQGAAALPAEAFFRHPSLSGAALSPSGLLVALKSSNQAGRAGLVVLDLATMALKPVASFDDADIGRFHWVNDKRLVFDVADNKLAAADQYMAPGLFAVNADGSAYRQLVMRHWAPDEGRPLPWKTFLLEPRGARDSDEVFVWQPDVLTEKEVDYIQLKRLNTVTGLATDVDAPAHAFQWLLDGRGELRAVLTAKGGAAAIHWRDPATDKWRRLREFERYGEGSDIALEGVTDDGKLYVNARPGRDTQALYTYDPATDTLAAQPLVGTPQYDIDATLIQRGGRLLGVRFTVDAEITQWFDEALKAEQAVIDQRLPATANMITPPLRGDSPWLLVRAFADVQPTRWYVYHRGSKKLVLLGSTHPAVNARQMSPMDMVRYKARDGMEIPAYLTLPAAAASKKKLPLIVYVHGGPWVRGATWEWQPEVQFLASRGYAVLQPEFRGSTGFGERHMKAGFKQWGLAMQDDLADGARWAIAQGIADPQRIAIMGASYGGYATLMGLAKDGDLFRCGVEWVGVSDLQLMYDAHWSDMSDNFKQYGMPARLGDREKDAAMLLANSPLQQAARIKRPLLMAYGRIDHRVPIEHGERMRDALKPHNPGVEWVRYDKDGHGWSLPETEVDWWTRVEKFLARHMGTAP